MRMGSNGVYISTERVCSSLPVARRSYSTEEPNTAYLADHFRLEAVNCIRVRDQYIATRPGEWGGCGLNLGVYTA